LISLEKIHNQKDLLMKRKLAVLTVIGLFSLPTYASGQCCCSQPEKQQTQSQKTGSKTESCCPSMATGKAPAGVTSQTPPGKCPTNMQDQSSQKPEESGKEKK
jgi:hypothetical protein